MLFRHYIRQNDFFVFVIGDPQFALHARSIFNLRLWFQTILHPSRVSYHYNLTSVNVCYPMTSIISSYRELKVKAQRGHVLATDHLIGFC